MTSFCHCFKYVLAVFLLLVFKKTTQPLVFGILSVVHSCGCGFSLDLRNIVFYYENEPAILFVVKK